MASLTWRGRFFIWRGCEGCTGLARAVLAEQADERLREAGATSECKRIVVFLSDRSSEDGKNLPGRFRDNKCKLPVAEVGSVARSAVCDDRYGFFFCH